MLLHQQFDFGLELHGEVKHEDYVNDGIDQSNDFTWPNTCYTINTDLLPDDLKNGDDEDLAPLILAYHHKEIPKPHFLALSAIRKTCKTYGSRLRRQCP